MVAMKAKMILIVDDDPQSLELTTDLLESRGYQVLQTETAWEGLSLALIHRPDLILMDIQLPGLDGLTATRLLKGNRATMKIPVVAMTAYALREDQVRLLKAGFDGYLPKPIDTKGFLNLVAGFLKTAEAGGVDTVA